MFYRFKQYLWNTIYPPPVTWSDLMEVISTLSVIDSDIQAARYEQQITKDVYRFAVMEDEIERLMKKRAVVSRNKQSLMARARKQGPDVNHDLYEALV